MATTENLRIALPAEMASLVRNAVAAGEFASDSDVVTEALLEWEQRRKEQGLELGSLRRLWQEAVAEDSEGLDPDEVFSCLWPEKPAPRLLSITD